MVEIADIKDRESLKDWLEALPFDEVENRRIAVTIAHRAAMRVLPVYWNWANTNGITLKEELTALSILRCSLTSGVASDTLTSKIRTAAATAAAAAPFAFGDAGAFADAAAAAAFSVDTIFVDAVVATATNAAAAAAATTEDAVWEDVRADCRALTTPQTHFDHVPLWRNNNPLNHLWMATQNSLLEGYEFWRDWYQNALDGVNPNWDMLTEIALIEPADWDKGADHVNALIAGIVEGYEILDGPSNTELLGATLFDFTFDGLAGVMRAIPMPDDWKHLDDPQSLAAFLNDANDVRESFELLGAGLEAEGKAVQGGGAVRTYLAAVLSELGNARDVGALRVGKLLEYGRMLEAASHDDNTLLEFGVLAEPLKSSVENLRELVRAHFSNTLARFTVLRELEFEADATPWEVLREFRGIVARVEDGNKGVLPPLDKADAAVLQDILDSADGLLRSEEKSSDANAKSGYRREASFQLAKIGATASVYREKATVAASKGGAATDSTLKWWKRSKGLGALARAIKELFETGSGA